MKGQFLIKCDFSYSCAAADKISTDLRARAVSLRQLSYLLYKCSQFKFCKKFELSSPHVCVCTRVRARVRRR